MANAVSANAPSLHIHAEITQLGLGDSSNLLQNVQQGLTSLAQAAQTALQSLNAVSGGGGAPASSAPAAAPGAFSGGGGGGGGIAGLSSAWSEKFSQMASVGAMLDNMEKEATELMKSPKKEDQIKGQQMMAAMQQIMEAIIKAIQTTASAAQHAIQGSQAH